MNNLSTSRKKPFLLLESLIAMALFALCIPFLFESLQVSRRQLVSINQSLESTLIVSDAFSNHLETLCIQDKVCELLSNKHIIREGDDVTIETELAKTPKVIIGSFPILLRTSIQYKNLEPQIFWHTLYVEKEE